MKLNRDGLPVDARDWSRADWQDLHEALERAKHAIRQRHCEPDKNSKPDANKRAGRLVR
jgi:hypothetical protein